MWSTSDCCHTQYVRIYREEECAISLHLETFSPHACQVESGSIWGIEPRNICDFESGLSWGIESMTVDDTGLRSS